MNLLFYNNRGKIMEINQKIKELIDSNDVCLFMKGTILPQCGFSICI